VNKGAFFGLKERGWLLEPNLHFSYMYTNLVWTQDCAFRRYFDYWMAHQDKICKVERGASAFKTLFSHLLDIKQITGKQLKELEKAFAKTKRDHVNVCPGFLARYYWDIGAACAMNDDGKLVDEVRSRVKEALATWGQELPHCKGASHEHNGVCEIV
jgi:hypothetical protein